jgi:tellurite resistance protein
LQRESEPIAADQNRIRENRKALQGTCEEKALLQSYLGQLDSEESRLVRLRKETADLTAQQTVANRELDRMIMEVSAEESYWFDGLRNGAGSPACR